MSNSKKGFTLIELLVVIAIMFDSRRHLASRIREGARERASVFPLDTPRLLFVSVAANRTVSIAPYPARNCR